MKFVTASVLLLATLVQGAYRNEIKVRTEKDFGEKFRRLSSFERPPKGIPLNVSRRSTLMRCTTATIRRSHTPTCRLELFRYVHDSESTCISQ